MLASDYEKITELSELLNEENEKLAGLYDEWERLQNDVEKFGIEI